MLYTVVSLIVGAFMKYTSYVKFALVSLLVLLSLFPGYWVKVSSADNSNRQVLPEHQIRWFALYIEEDKIGHYKLQRNVNLAADTVTTTLTSYMSLNREDVVLEMHTTEQSVETTKGEALSFSSIQRQGESYQSISGQIHDSGVVDIRIDDSGKVTSQRQQWQKQALLFEGLRLAGLKQGNKAGTQYTSTEYLISNLQVVKSQVTVGATNIVNVLGKNTGLTKVTSKVIGAAASGNVVSYIDQQHNLFKVVMPFMDTHMRLEAVSKEVALSSNQKTDIFTRSFIDAPIAVSIGQVQKPLEYLIETQNSQVKFPVSDEQQFSKLAANAGQLTVTPLKGVHGGVFPYRGKELDMLRYLAPNNYVQSDDERIIKLAKRVVGDSQSATQAAQKLESFVRDYISIKDLSVGYGTATQVLDSRRGDCTEHAVLLTAMLKAVGIPARVATGMVYMDNFAEQRQTFVPHAWVQANIVGKWLSYDAALSGFSSGHILIGHGSGMPLDFINMASTIGNFAITEISAVY